MQARLQLSTSFATAQHAHQLRVLVTLESSAPPRRPPINVALVLDRSGSMAGAPLEAAKDAATRFAGFLSAQDRLTIIAFDEQVRTVYGPGPGGAPEALAAIARLQPGGSTNLSGGWLEGRRAVAEGLVEGTNRVVLLTDGQANVGIVQAPLLAGLAGGGRNERVSTTCIGFGAGFSEDLLRGMSEAGGGNFWYVEQADQMAPVFQGEIEGLVALAAQNVRIEVLPVHPRLGGVSFVPSVPVATAEAGWQVALGDLYATSPRAQGIVAHVEDVAELGTVTVAEVRVRADVVSEAGITQQVITLPLVANLDGTTRVEPVVEQTFLAFEVARAREEALAHADRGDLEAAAQRLQQALGAIDASPGGATQFGELREDISAAVQEFRQRVYTVSDRKYHMARQWAEERGRGDYVDKVSRRRKRPE